MKKEEKKEYCTRMQLKQEKGWTDKMIATLLPNVDYKRWGNFYRWRNNKIIPSERYRKDRKH